jgi:mono/diheme cytochrome c family protein
MIKSISSVIILLLSVFILNSCHTAGKQTIQPMSSAELMMSEGKRFYGRYCSRCHGISAEGGTSYTAPALNRLNRPAFEIHTLISEGYRNMPAFKGLLNPTEIEAVVMYVQSLKTP